LLPALSPETFNEVVMTKMKFELWNANRRRAIESKRGQAFLQELLEALDELPQKRLIQGAMEQSGEVCALGTVGLKRCMDLDGLHSRDHDEIADAFGISSLLAQEIAYWNDQGMEACLLGLADGGGWKENTPEDRFTFVRAWVVARISVNR
jgi:hypothetical protein